MDSRTKALANKARSQAQSSNPNKRNFPNGGRMDGNVKPGLPNGGRAYDGTKSAWGGDAGNSPDLMRAIVNLVRALRQINPEITVNDIVASMAEPLTIQNDRTMSGDNYPGNKKGIQIFRTFPDPPMSAVPNDRSMSGDTYPGDKRVTRSLPQGGLIPQKTRLEDMRNDRSMSGDTYPGDKRVTRSLPQGGLIPQKTRLEDMRNDRSMSGGTYPGKKRFVRSLPQGGNGQGDGEKVVALPAAGAGPGSYDPRRPGPR